NTTRIEYNIPETGDVIFYVHSVSGQLLYSQTIEAASGKQSLELNTSSFAAGIYFYSIEYKGQRLVKRMIVQ
ncbi:MAG: T9SS type A sorting domain-containing protein, partial [Bacteroidales bacterium]|nr:T9SS type A sorting domain-containing protein [Bacteroidales bacterium]